MRRNTTWWGEAQVQDDLALMGRLQLCDVVVPEHFGLAVAPFLCIFAECSSCAPYLSSRRRS